MPSAPSPRILVVDNDPMIRFVLRLQLEEQGYCVTTCESGKQALHLLQTTPHSYAALIDVVMPEMDGIDVLDAIARDPRLLHRHAFALMTGAYPRLAARTDRLLARLEAPVLLKPYDMDELFDIAALLTERLPANHLSAA